MVRKTVVYDDFDDRDIADQSVTWLHPMDGHAYRSDLIDSNVKLLIEALEPFRERAEDLGPATLMPGDSTPKPREDPAEPQALAAEPLAPGWYRTQAGDSPGLRAAKRQYQRDARAWLLENDHNVGLRGKIPDEYMDLYGQHRAEAGLPVGHDALESL